MNLQSERELVNTKRKLRLLEEGYEEARADTEGDEHLRELEMQSLRRLINQLKEEISRYEAHQPLHSEASRSGTGASSTLST